MDPAPPRGERHGRLAVVTRWAHELQLNAVDAHPQDLDSKVGLGIRRAHLAAEKIREHGTHDIEVLDQDPDMVETSDIRWNVWRHKYMITSQPMTDRGFVSRRRETRADLVSSGLDATTAGGSALTR